jgi:predicted GIY-YIG superfamily endonuclease
MIVSQLIPNVTERVRFSLKFRKFLPASSGCYVLANFFGEVLYVGLTDSLNRRFREHRETKEKRDATTQGTGYWFYYLGCEPRELARVERTWINQHVELHGVRPILNKVDSPIS